MSQQAETVTPVLERFDPYKVREEFPILSRQVYGKPLVYLDSAASAQKPEQVIDTVSQVYREGYSNIHRGAHFLGGVATENYENAREKVRAFINARSASEIVFMSGSTEAINAVASSWGAPNIGEGDEIILSVMEHHSNIVPWHFLRERQGAVLKWVPLREDGSLDMDAFKAAFSERTKFVAMIHMSNVLGTVTPAKEIVRIAHQHGVPVLLDGSQAVPHMPVDVTGLDCDFYVFTGHKLFGPSGIGVLYGKGDRLKAMRPYKGGGEMIERVTRDGVTYAPPPAKFEAGTMAIAQAIGLGAAVDFLGRFDRHEIVAHEEDLRAYATERMREINALKIYGDAPGKGSIVSFAMEGIHPHDIATIIDREGVAVRAGHHCAQPLMETLGVMATARASFALYNTREDVDVLVDALRKCRELFG